MNILWCDFETRSRCDLKRHGVYNYAMDSSTEVLCLCYAFDDEEVQTWVPSYYEDGTLDWDEFPPRIRQRDIQIRAHNAAFERLIFKHVLGIAFDDEQFYCTAAEARANCAPGALGDTARFAGAEHKKDHRGAQLIRWMCIPDAQGKFNNDPALMQELINYCAQDVRAMRATSKARRQLTDIELHDYHVNERINDRGVLVDVPLCNSAVQYAATEREEIEALVQELTDGELASVRSPKMKEWVYERVGPDIRKLMEVYKDGEKKTSIDKTVRSNILRITEDEKGGMAWQVPPHVADVIQCADDLWASSVAKFQRLADLANCEDDRVRGSFVFAGGSATGRAASFGAQVHNFTRKCADDPEAVRNDMVRGKAIIPAHGRVVTEVLKGMLRPALIPAPGKKFVVADWSSIEARVTPWCADSAEGDAKLDLFETGADVYKVNAATTFKKKIEEITKDERQIGKVQELACGFSGGVGAFAAMGKAYGVHLSDAESQRMVDGWRRANPWAMPYWQELERAYTRAIRNPLHEFSVGRVTYMYDRVHLWYVLPSGRILCYPYAKIEDGCVTYAKASWKPEKDAKEWPRATLWRGLACENITQAVAADILRHSLRELDDLYYDIVLHVHDEIVIEADDPETTIADMKAIMTTPPDWADTLPLAIEIQTLNRYGK